MRVIRINSCGECPHRIERQYGLKKFIFCKLAHRDVTQAVRDGSVHGKCPLPDK